MGARLWFVFGYEWTDLGAFWLLLVRFKWKTNDEHLVKFSIIEKCLEMVKRSVCVRVVVCVFWGYTNHKWRWNVVKERQECSVVCFVVLNLSNVAVGCWGC